MFQRTAIDINNQLRRAIEQLRGIEVAHIVMSDSAEVMEVHVVATPERKPKQVVRDIESLLMAQLGIEVDYRKISVAQMRESLLVARTPRPQLVAAGYADQERRHVQVVLEEGGQQYTGTAKCTPNATDPLTLAAQATLSAIHGVVGRHSVFRLVDAKRTRLGEKDIIMVLITAAHEGGEETLVGTCFARDDVLEACARATLDSINRRIAVLVS
jgi:hypothetical protein